MVRGGRLPGDDVDGSAMKVRIASEDQEGDEKNRTLSQCRLPRDRATMSNKKLTSTVPK